VVGAALSLLRSFPPPYAAAPLVLVSKDSRTQGSAGRAYAGYYVGLGSILIRCRASPCVKGGAVPPLSPPPPNAATQKCLKPQDTDNHRTQLRT